MLTKNWTQKNKTNAQKHPLSYKTKAHATTRKSLHTHKNTHDNT